MKEMMTTQDTEVWYRASTLAERLSSLRQSTHGSPSPVDDLARSKLQRWKEQVPFNKAGYFARRLAADGLHEEELLHLLAGAGLAQTEPEARWITLLKQIAQHDNHDEFVIPQLSDSGQASISMFLVALMPLLKNGLQHLRAGVQALSLQYKVLPFEPESTLPLLLAGAVKCLLPIMMKTVVLELNVARVQGRLQGETPEERFQYFLRYLGQGGLWPLLEEYPVLARLLLETIEQSVNRSLELLQRLCADWQEIQAAFVPAGHDLGPLVDIQTGKGDSHRGGNSVTILSWNSGFRLVYKPRSLSIDEHFHELLAWLNEQGYQPIFRPFKLINKKTYGWVEFIEPSSCTSSTEVERFYQRQGGYLAVLYALGAVDFHAENLIADGEYPVLIDLEALFHPRMRSHDPMLQSYPGMDFIDHSVLAIGLLPQRLWSGDDAEGIDYSGLGYQAGQMSPRPVPTLTGVGTDQMRFGRERGELMMAGSPRPRLNGQDVDLLEYFDSVIEGFVSAYRLLLRHREALLHEVLPRFANDDIRCLMRPTQAYKLLQADSYHPDMLRDALDLDRHLDYLWVGVEQQPFLERVIAAERADLWTGDIPVFTSHPDSHSVYTSSGLELENFFDETGFDMARRMLARFSEQDLEKQVWMIRASFMTTISEIDKSAQRLLKLRPTNTPVSSERFLAAARSIGDRLCDLALYREGVVGWLGLTPVNEREWHVQASDLDLYSGVSGIALFLAYLGSLTGESRYNELARQALNSVRKQVQFQQESGSLSIGAFSGAGSFIYLLSHLGSLWNEPELYREAAQLVETLPDLISKDELFDVVNGSAGCISALLSLYVVAPSISTLLAALQCGDHLLAHTTTCPVGIGWCARQQQTPLLGLSHGNAGAILNLLRLFSVSGEERFYQTALEALAYERSQYSPTVRNWPDLRSDVRDRLNDEQQAYMVAWCHGAPGVALARLGTLHLIDNNETRAEIAAALQTTIERGFGSNHSLCHGDMGNLDVLLSASELLGEQRYAQEVQRLSAMLLASIEEQGWVTGVPQGVETPGLMTGLAGIGYTLLRLAAPSRVPSVLLLDPPLPPLS